MFSVEAQTAAFAANSAVRSGAVVLAALDDFGEPPKSTGGPPVLPSLWRGARAPGAAG